MEYLSKAAGKFNCLAALSRADVLYSANGKRQDWPDVHQALQM
jgi:hypothetical protein